MTAVAAEADSVAGGLASAGPGEDKSSLPGGFTLRRHARADVLVAGVGPAAAAAATATALACAPAPYALVVSAGIAGGFAPHAPLGAVVVADAVVGADLGAQTPEGYLPVDALGFGRSAHPVAGELVARISGALADGGRPCAVGPVLTVSTVTGTAERAAELAARHPGAVAEAMEGFGVAEAAAAYGLPVVEVRAVSNAVGPRDRAAWRIGEALAALRDAFGLLDREVFPDVVEAAGTDTRSSTGTRTGTGAAPETAAGDDPVPTRVPTPVPTPVESESPS